MNLQNAKVSHLYVYKFLVTTVHYIWSNATITGRWNFTFQTTNHCVEGKIKEHGRFNPAEQNAECLSPNVNDQKNLEMRIFGTVFILDEIHIIHIYAYMLFSRKQSHVPLATEILIITVIKLFFMYKQFH